MMMISDVIMSTSKKKNESPSLLRNRRQTLEMSATKKSQSVRDT